MLAWLRPLPGLIRPTVTGFVGPPLMELLSRIVGFVDSKAHLNITVTYHGAAEPTPSASPSPGPLSGLWRGTYASGVYEISGSFTVRLTQSATSLTGTIQISGSRCVTNGSVNGSVDGTNVTFGAVQAEQTVSFTGTLQGGKSMAGTFSSPSCGDDAGSWQATKS